MKKTLLSLGTLVSTIAPVASVIACGDGDVPGHEAPYSISIQADASTPTQANVFVNLKGFVTDSYIKEIKSRIAESIVAANKDLLKYSTMKIYIGDKTSLEYSDHGTVLSIITSPLINTNKNNLDVIFNLIDKPFDDFIQQLKSKEFFKEFFQKEIWGNEHHQIEKLDQNEVKRNLLEYLGYDSSNPNTIDVKYNSISNKFIDLTVIRTNVTSNPELHSTTFADQTTDFFDFLEGDTFNIKMIINDGIIAMDEKIQVIYRSKTTPSNSIICTMGPGKPQRARTQMYKIAQYLVNANGYKDELSFTNDLSFDSSSDFHELSTLGDSASRIFEYGSRTKATSVGMNYDRGSSRQQREYAVNFNKKTFKIKIKGKPYSQYQWFFGTDGNLIVGPGPREGWTLEFEGTYELNDAGNAIETTSLTKAIAMDASSKTINLLKSSVGIISKEILNDEQFFINK